MDRPDQQYRASRSGTARSAGRAPDASEWNRALTLPMALRWPRTRTAQLLRPPGSRAVPPPLASKPELLRAVRVRSTVRLLTTPGTTVSVPPFPTAPAIEIGAWGRRQSNPRPRDIPD